MHTTRRELICSGAAALGVAGMGLSANQANSAGKKRALCILGDAWHCVAPIDSTIGGQLRKSAYQIITIVDYAVPFDDFDKYDLIVLSRYAYNDITFFRERDLSPSRKERTRWITPAEEQKFEDYVKAGGRLLLHHDGIGFYPKDGAISRLAKAFFIKHPPITSTKISPTGKMPELARGITPFTVADEEFQVEVDENQTSVYLESHSPEHGRAPQAWAHTYGKGKVAVFIPGHDRVVLSKELIQRGIQNVISWLSS